MSVNENTLIGILDDEITEQHHIDWSVSKIGGNPIWFSSTGPTINDCKFSCRICGKTLVFVAQIYCPLEKSSYHRTLCIFACIRKGCWNKSGSWLIIRCQEKDLNLFNHTERSNVSVHHAEETWHHLEDDWDDDNKNVISDWNSTMLQCSMEAANLSISDKTHSPDESFHGSNRTLEESLNEEIENDEIFVCSSSDTNLDLPDWSIKKSDASDFDKDFQPMFRSYYVSVINESTIVHDGNDSIERLAKEFENAERVNRTLDGLSDKIFGGENYESTQVKHGDVTFHKFAKKLSLCPHQIIRYKWNGKPLHMTATNDVSVPACENCGKPRIFEMQLMPPLVNYLQLFNAEIESSSLEFGVVIVSSCQDSCWNDGDTFREEHVHVQADPDEQYFSKIEEKKLPR